MGKPAPLQIHLGDPSPHFFSIWGVQPQHRPTRPETIKPTWLHKTHGYHTPIKAHMARNNQAHMATQNTWVSHPSAGPHGLKQLAHTATQNTWVSHPNQGPHGLTQLAHTATQNTKHLGITPQLRPTWPQHHSHKQLGPAAKTVGITNKRYKAQRPRTRVSPGRNSYTRVNGQPSAGEP